MQGTAPKTEPRELMIHTPDGKIRALTLDRDRFGVGRSSANELCYPEDAGLSRQHLVIERTPAGWSVRDLGSKNGTLVNGQRLTGVHALSPGDRITAGHLTLEMTGARPMPVLDRTVMFVESPAETPISTTVTSLEGLSDQGLAGGPQMRALIRAGRELAGHKPLSELFTLIMDNSIEAVGAARGVLMTVEDGTLIVRAAKGEGFRISTTVRDKVLNDRASVLVRDARLDAAFAARESIVEQQIRSILAVPLQTETRVIGLIYLDSPHFVKEFTRDDLNLLTVMANVAAIRIEHARLAEVEQTERLMAKELDQAAEIQRGLLPVCAPVVAGLDLAGYNAACRTVGGDYYDFIPYADGRVAMLVADVSGKGMPAALLMSSLQARVQVLFDDPNPEGFAAVVTKLNRVVTSNCPGNRFITFFAAILDAATGSVTWCNAGHNPPLLVHADGSFEKLEGTGVPLGILAQAHYEQKTVRLTLGDVLVLFSDGVTEAMPVDVDEEYGEDRLAQAVADLRTLPANEIIEGIQRKLQAFTSGAPMADDVTLVVARLV
jgi:sigma-B regulation protein RsbU (phosphoserine phosphatase)